MELNNLVKTKNIKSSKRIGRGESSGKGKTSTKGMKGQKSRGRGKIRLGFEGGQLPLIKRLPFRRGVGNNKPRLNITITLDQLRVFESGAKVNNKTLIEKGLLMKTQNPYLIKIVAKGEIDKPLNIEIAATQKAKSLIEKAKGSVVKTEKKEVKEEADA